MGLVYGPVKVIKGKYKGLIGYYDDDDDKDKAIVYRGDMFGGTYVIIPCSSLTDDITINDLKDRIESLTRKLVRNTMEIELDYWELHNIHEELHYAEKLLNARYFEYFTQIRELKKAVFISHSSADTALAMNLALDLGNKGINAWLDIWDIKLGHSIPYEISKGIEDSEAIILLYSKSYKDSTFCNDEWESFYTKYNKSKKNAIIPVLIGEGIEVPTIIGARKYYRFNRAHNAYDMLVQELIRALKD